MIIGIIPLLMVILKKRDEPSDSADNRRGGGTANSDNQQNVQTGSVSGRKICLNGKAFFLDEELYENRTNISMSEPSVDEFKNDERLQLLKKIAKESDVYIIIQVSNDDEQNYYQDLMEKKYGFFNSVKILFCETVRGKIAFARQVNPSVCIDVDRETTRELNRFLPFVSIVTKNGKNGVNMDNVLEGNSLVELVNNPSFLKAK